MLVTCLSIAAVGAAVAASSGRLLIATPLLLYAAVATSYAASEVSMKILATYIKSSKGMAMDAVLVRFPLPPGLW